MDTKMRKVEFSADGVKLRGNLYIPKGEAYKYPAIVMAHGFAAVKEMHICRFAEEFAAHGFAVLLFDNRNFGESDGLPRQEIVPWQQAEDYRHAITYLTTQEQVDENRIGIWGTSFSGGHCLTIGASDSRVKCIVSQVPTISGFENAVRRGGGEKQKALFAQFSEDRKRRMDGEDPGVMQVIPLEEGEPAVFPSQDAVEWYSAGMEIAPNFVNEVTLRSVENARAYEVGNYMKLISPVPLLMLVAKEDFITPTDIALLAYEAALEPKKLVLLEGGHFSAYTEGFDTAFNEALAWFTENL